MVVSEKLKFVFLAIPRTGSVSITQALLKLDGAFVMPGDRHRMNIDEKHKDFTTFCCVRNPYARICSHWAKVKQQNGYKKTFAEFLQDVLHRRASEKPQVRWLGSNRIDHFLSFENLNPDFHQLSFIPEGLVLPRKNVSGVDWKTHYDERRARIVRRWAAADFKKFNYDLESWRS